MKRLALFSALLVLAGTPRERAQHALDRLAFGTRPGDVERVLAIGVDRWIEQQLHPERIDDRAVESRIASYDTRVDIPSRDALKNDKQMLRRAARQAVGNLSAQRILRAAESERQLNEVMVDFWMNHFNVFAGKNLDLFLIASYERDTIRPRIWGRFEDLLMATAKSPAMLVYLDNARSRNGAINENYAREIMELHTLGVDGGYTQQDVTELARVFTGWSISRPQGDSVDFVFRRALHDPGMKRVLGVTLSNGGIDEGERMIRFLAKQPATARHIATKLCQRLVTDDPPRALVDRVAKRFLDTNGDLRATVKAVIDAPEFWNPRNMRAKTKSPFEYAISAVRAAGATIENPLPLARELKNIGEPLYFSQPPTGYSDAAETWSNSGALVARLNFATALANNKMPGVRVTTRDAVALAKQLGGPEFQKQ
ncbi:MAG TPA: DUF1800 domain-containing protein [Thermoanaerobaculia bacterium]|nr:DUF1800 domain-containing protein [Thermoanaerobaculia bacterium]